MTARPGAKRVGLLALATAVVSGCCSVPDPSQVSSVPVSAVLNALKDELRYFITEKPNVIPAEGACYKAGTSAGSLNLVPVKASVNLKTVAKQQSSKNLALAEPFGVVAFEPSFSGAYSQTRTQNLQITLDPQLVDPTNLQKPTGQEYRIGAALVALRDELLKADHDKQPCLAYEEGSVIKLTVGFDVVKESSDGFGLKLVVFKVGAKETETAQTIQTLDLELALVGGQNKLAPPLQ